MTPHELYNMFLSGKSLEELGNILNVSKQRISQILKPFRIEGDLRLNRPAKEYERSTYAWKYKKQSNIFYTRRKQAHDLKIEWTIKPQDIVWPERCPILDLELDYTRGKGRSDNSPSLDRIDPMKGYTPDNICIISWRANRIKNDGTAEEHKKIAYYMTSHLESQV